ncbi:MAG: diguanylate cyclase, partial [Pseudomonadota bacterium]|nr:diguanylate cyclase [Pseudomonadota bacterium]
PESALAYASYGFLSYTLERKLRKCDHFTQLALKLAWRNHQQTQVVMLIYTHIKPWQVHLKTILSALLKTCQHHLSTCQQPLTVMCACTYCSSAYLLGHELSEQEKKINFYGELLSNNTYRLPLHHLFHQVVLNLLGHSATPTQLKGRYFDETTTLTQLFQSHDNSALALFYLNKLILYYLFNDHQQAVENAILTENYLDSLQGTWFMPLFYFYAALARLGLYTTLPFSHTLSQYIYHQRLLKQVRGYQKKLQLWAQDAPMNYAHKYALLQAEYERVKGRHHHARNHYHQAIALAQQNDYLNEEALAYELTAKFYLNIEEQQLAHYYLRNAHHAYQRWGATAKVDALETYYTEIFWHTSLSPPTINYINTLNTLSSSTTDISQFLDLNSIFKAQQTIVSEIILDKLLVKLMKIVIETAGAQRGSLLLNQQGQWFIEAQSTQYAQEIKVLQAIPLTPLPHLPTTMAASEEMLPLGCDEWTQNSVLSTTQPLNNHQLPLSVIHYVIRTQTSVVLPNATQDNQFQADPYIIKQQVKSLLCLPLIHQNKLIAILYLENNLAPGVFTAARLQVLSLLSSHIAIAIDKAQSYANTQALNSQLRESEERFRVIAETTPIPLIITRFIDGVLLYANAQAMVYLGLKKPLHQYKISDFLTEQQLLELFQNLASIQNYEIQLKNTPNNNIWVALSSHPIHYNNEKVLLSALYDITERKQAEEERSRFTKALSESEERFRIIAETTPIPLVIFNAQHGLILYANASIDTILGLPATELIHKYHIEEFFDTQREYQHLLTQLAQKGCVRNYELKLKKNDKSIVYAEISIQPLIFKDEQVLFGAIYDITARKRIEEERIRFIQEREAKNAALQLNVQLQQEISERLCAEAALEKANQELSRLATLDSLTQLANRRRLDEYLAAEWQRLMREQAPLSFIICDIDYFKRYNDTYGHQTGDDCLQQVAQAMSRAVKRPADLLARYGGEEFAVILPYTDAEGAVLVASAMRWEVKLLKIPHRYSTVTEYVTLSMGVSSVIPQRHLSPRSLVNAADKALYEAKAQGRNRIILKTL